MPCFVAAALLICKDQEKMLLIRKLKFSKGKRMWWLIQEGLIYLLTEWFIHLLVDLENDKRTLFIISVYEKHWFRQEKNQKILMR